MQHDDGRWEVAGDSRWDRRLSESGNCGVLRVNKVYGELCHAVLLNKSLCYNNEQELTSLDGWRAQSQLNRRLLRVGMYPSVLY